MKIQNDNYVKITTQRVVLDYPHLLKPYVNPKVSSSTPRYGSTIIIPEGDTITLQRVDEGIKETISRFKLNQNNLQLPLQDGNVKHPYDSLYRNCMFFYASSELKPKVVDTKIQEIKYRYDEFERGTYAKVSLILVPYDYNNKCGISMKLENVQIFPHNKLFELRSKPEDDFVVEEDEEDDVED